jgi:hypothetical protein
MSDRQFIQTILNALTDDYGNLVEKVEDKIDEGTAVGIEDLKEKLAAKYTRIKVWGKQEKTKLTNMHCMAPMPHHRIIRMDSANCAENADAGVTSP